jgi:hypothetical protein
MGTARRSLLQKAVRLEKQNAKISTILAKEREAVRVDWNCGRLRRGDRLATQGVIRRKQKVWRHKNAWSLRGVLHLAFDSLGRTTPSAKSQRTTRRELDAIAAVALSYRERVNENVKLWGLQLLHGIARPKWVFIERAWDASPVKLTFGCLRSVLAPVARYWPD